MIKNLVTSDLDQIIANGGGIFTFASQPAYGWTVEIVPGYVLSIAKDKEPNAFWRSIAVPGARLPLEEAVDSPLPPLHNL